MADKLNAKNVAKKSHIAKAVCEYLIYVESNFRRALDIASEATINCKALTLYKNETSLRIGIARIHDLLNDPYQAY